jgi:hypothetical protein
MLAEFTPQPINDKNYFCHILYNMLAAMQSTKRLMNCQISEASQLKQERLRAIQQILQYAGSMNIDPAHFSARSRY